MYLIIFCFKMLSVILIKKNILRGSIGGCSIRGNWVLLNNTIFIMRIVHASLGILLLLITMSDGMRKRGTMFTKSWSSCIIKHTQVWIVHRSQYNKWQVTQQMWPTFCSKYPSITHIQKNITYEYKPDKRRKKRNKSRNKSKNKNKNKIKISRHKCIEILMYN